MSAVVTPLVLRDAIAEALWAHVRAQDLAEVCVYLGLEPQGEYENPFDSKRGYVRARLLTKSMDELAELARRSWRNSAMRTSQWCSSDSARTVSPATTRT
jgi:hypothetical protein